MLICDIHCWYMISIAFSLKKKKFCCYCCCFSILYTYFLQYVVMFLWLLYVTYFHVYCTCCHCIWQILLHSSVLHTKKQQQIMLTVCPAFGFGTVSNVWAAYYFAGAIGCGISLVHHLESSIRQSLLRFHSHHQAATELCSNSANNGKRLWWIFFIFRFSCSIWTCSIWTKNLNGFV